ncbi:hypothetical protein Hanom_Chr01g00058831 [Helianthus anomalus]
MIYWHRKIWYKTGEPSPELRRPATPHPAAIPSAKNGDWFTFETSKVDTCLISSMVTTLGSWKDRFFWVSESIVPFKMVWRHPDAVLNDPEPSESELNDAFLSAIRGCPSRVRPFPEHLLVLLGVSNIWGKADRDPVLMRNGIVMSALDFIKSDDTSDVVEAGVEKDKELVVHGKKVPLQVRACTNQRTQTKR